MPIPRQEAQDLAASYVDEADRALLARRRGLVSIGPTEITIVRCLHSHLLHRIADVLQNQPMRSVRRRARAELHRAKTLLRGRARAALGEGRWKDDFGKSGPGMTTVLAVPRTTAHFRDMLLVARHEHTMAKAKVFWVAFREDHHRAIIEAGFDAVLAETVAPLPLLDLVRIRTEMAIERRRWHTIPSEVAIAIVRIVNELASHALVAAHVLSLAMDRLSPSLVWVGSPITVEGCVAAAAARARAIPTATLQHGELGPKPFEWARSQIDLFMLWGDGARENLINTGVAAHRTVVTGNPWLDRKAEDSPRRRSSGGGSRRILIALSGAGHAVGMSEHLTHVQALVDAARAMPQHQWTFRLHRKDDPAIYRRIMGERPPAHIALEEALHSNRDIYEALSEADVLITVTSTAALDAMLGGVPVVSLNRAPGEDLAKYVTAGATTPSELSAIASVVARVLESGAAEETTRRAREYVESFSGVSDGGSAVRVAEALLAVAEQRRALR